jgi:hypothetical protein
MELSIGSRERAHTAECQKLFRLQQQQSANSNLQTDFQRRVNAKTTLGSIIVALAAAFH